MTQVAGGRWRTADRVTYSIAVDFSLPPKSYVKETVSVRY